MKKFVRTSLWVLAAVAPVCGAGEMPDCFTGEVEAHVIGQLRIHGPLSRDREYFGFVYRLEGRIESATVHGSRCFDPRSCEVKTKSAAAGIPRHAKVLAEWHTHPRELGAETLSPEDVRGANGNRHIRCYRAFFSTSKGDILTWDTNATSVTAAMKSAVFLANFRAPDVSNIRHK